MSMEKIDIDKILKDFDDEELTNLVHLGLKFFPIQNYTVYDERNVLVDTLLSMSNIEQERLDKAYSFDVTNSELFALWVLYGRDFSVLQEPFFNPSKRNDFTIALHRAFDSLLLKAPKFQGGLLYRNDNYFHIEYIKGLYKQGKPFITPHYFTTDYEDYEKNTGVNFIIHSLREATTRAREVYQIMIFNDKVPFPEHQINYEKNTSFKIESIHEGEERFVVVLRELE